MNLNDFDYNLPRDLIAQRPSKPRSSSKLLVVEKNIISTFSDIYKFLDENDILVINNTRVIPAVIISEVNKKKVKITLHTKLSSNNWIAFAKPSSFLEAGSIINFKDNITAKVLDKKGAHVELSFNLLDNKSVYDFLNKYGELPIPPYIKIKDSKENNEKNYQSIFSKNYGAYASPTASLHFDSELLNNIKKKNIDIIEITLHVGAGTFLPLKNNFVERNKLHKEKGLISYQSALKISNAIKAKKRVVALGTTVLRLLEDCYMKYSEIKQYNEETNLFIYPGFKFKVVDKLITNFHLPKSSLFLLVSAFGGNKKVMHYYNYAIEKKMRFFSYGDGMIINRFDEI